MEAALTVLARTKLQPVEQVAVLQLLLVHALGEARLAIDLVKGPRGPVPQRPPPPHTGSCSLSWSTSSAIPR